MPEKKEKGTVEGVDYDHTHVSKAEAVQAANPNVGEGDPASAPARPAEAFAETADPPPPGPGPVPSQPNPIVTEPVEVEEPSGKPTRKLLTVAVSAAVLYGLSLIVPVDETLEQAVNVLVPVILGYIVPNEPTPGGVPQKEVAVEDEPNEYIKGP